MILTATDEIQTTEGPVGPSSLIGEKSYLYGFDGKDMIPVEQRLVSNQFVSSALRFELTAKRRDNKPQYAYIPYDY